MPAMNAERIGPEFWNDVLVMEEQTHHFEQIAESLHDEQFWNELQTMELRLTDLKRRLSQQDFLRAMWNLETAQAGETIRGTIKRLRAKEPPAALNDVQRDLAKEVGKQQTTEDDRKESSGRLAA